ncbi:GNAT family N-acetyltransferase [Cohnella kolymensis]|nr:GNAT family N-acetyltransferase [Cohnella kolymensis]
MAAEMKCLHITTDDLLREALNIRMKVFVEEQGVPPDLELDEYDESPTSCRHFIVLDDNRPIATGRWKPYEPGVAKMQRIAVLKSYRGTGVGRLLLQGMEDDARQCGCAESLLDAQCTAEDFYRKLGYVTESIEPFLDADILHVRMRKNLRS